MTVPERADRSGSTFVVHTTQGALRGVRDKYGVQAVKGIPYAAAPFGQRRFHAPGPAPSWAGVRDATIFGATAPKSRYRDVVRGLLAEPDLPGEECLNLNVWTPDVAATGLPVFVWFHGGAFVNGSSAVPTYDGAAFARDGLVCVTPNYRLGADGYAALPGRPANRGLLDQIAALRWVRDNIATFGGDPDQVTVGGESAGAMSTGALLASDASRGLFRRAALQSGAGHNVIQRETAEKVLRALAEQLGVVPTAEALAQVPLYDLLHGQVRMRQRIADEVWTGTWGELDLTGMPWQPHVDGEVIPERPIEAITRGAGADVDVLIGTTADEHMMFYIPEDDLHRLTEADLDRRLERSGVDAARGRAAYGYPGDRTAGETLVQVIGDWLFWIPAIRLAEARADAAASTHLYEFGWRSNRYDGRMGACHALDNPFVFDTLGSFGSDWLTGDSPPQKLADEMHGVWLSFVRGDGPGWPAYGSDRHVRRFDIDEPRDMLDPRPGQRRLWDGLR